MKKYIIGGLLALAVLCGVQYYTANATTCLYPGSGGTGCPTGATTGYNLYVATTTTIGSTTYPIYGYQANGSGGGGGSSTLIYAGNGILVNASGTGYIIINNGVTSFNGATGTVFGVSSVNGATGTVLFGIPATTTINGNQASIFNIIASGVVTSTVSGATTTFSCPTCIATNTGNWAGTVQGYTLGTIVTHGSGDYYLSTNPSAFIPLTALSASNPITYNSSTGAIGWTNSNNYLTTDQYWTGTSTNLVAATGRTSLGLGDSATLASTTWIKTGGALFSINGDTTVAQMITGANGVTTSTSGGLTTIGLGSITPSNVSTTNATATILYAGNITNNNVKSALVLNSAAGLEGAYGGASNCASGQAVIGISATGGTTCSSNSIGGVTTSSVGTANTLPIWTSGAALGNSNVSESATGTSTFINASTTYIGSSTSTATSSLVWISNGAGAGYWDATGTVPTVSSCGSSPSITGNIDRMRVTDGSGTDTSCTITFPITFKNIPSCIVTSETSIPTLAYSVTTSTLTITGTSLTSDVENASCEGQDE